VIVVDTNVIGYLYLSAERSRQAEKALLKDPDWVAPLLWRSELRDVLATYVSQQIIGIEDALGIMREAESLMSGGEYDVRSAEVLRLAARSGSSAYDCEFVALARDLNVPLVTVDRTLIRKFKDVSIPLHRFAVA
jgi:predicted nucleic acid-binding protein